MDMDFHIDLIYQEPIITPNVVDEFKKYIQSSGLKVLVKPASTMSAKAAFGWLVPTAIVAYIAKPYIESFLSEMGREHYAVLKGSLKKLWAYIDKQYGARAELSGPKSKPAGRPYAFSPVFSIEAQSPFGYRIKLLVQSDMQPEQFGQAIEAFLSFLTESCDTEALCEEGVLLLNNNYNGSVLPVCFDPVSGGLECVRVH